jgi:hypothetical protein
MNTYTLVHVPTTDGYARYNVYKNYESGATDPVLELVLMREAHEWLFANAQNEDWYIEAENSGYPGNSIGALRKLMAALDDAIYERITREEYNRIRDELWNK